MTVVDTFRIDLPPSWQNLPTDPDELRRLLSEQYHSEAWRQLAKVQQRRLELAMERLVADIESSRTVFASMFSEAVESVDANGDGERRVDTLVACCTMSVIERDAVGSSAPLTADVMLAAMTLTREGHGDTAESGTNLEPPAVVELPAGRSVRLLRLVEQRLSTTDTVSFFTETYFVPVPDDWETVIVAQFATPNHTDAAAFSELFAAVAGTIRFYRDDEPTTL